MWRLWSLELPIVWTHRGLTLSLSVICAMISTQRRGNSFHVLNDSLIWDYRATLRQLIDIHAFCPLTQVFPSSVHSPTRRNGRHKSGHRVLLLWTFLRYLLQVLGVGSRPRFEDQQNRFALFLQLLVMILYRAIRFEKTRLSWYLYFCPELAGYNNHSISDRMIDRIFSAAVNRNNPNRSGQMSYQVTRPLSKLFPYNFHLSGCECATVKEGVRPSVCPLGYAWRCNRHIFPSYNWVASRHYRPIRWLTGVVNEFSEPIFQQGMLGLHTRRPVSFLT